MKILIWWPFATDDQIFFFKDHCGNCAVFGTYLYLKSFYSCHSRKSSIVISIEIFVWEKFR